MKTIDDNNLEIQKPSDDEKIKEDIDDFIFSENVQKPISER